jgi:glycosyltransferase involved in cell wall biosynthesis
MKGKIQVLHVLDGLAFGGAEIWMLNCVQYIKQERQDVEFTFLLTGGLRLLLDEHFEKLNVRLIYCKFSRKNLFAFSITFRSILAENKFDAIYNHQDFVAGWHALLGIGVLPRKRIVHLHNPLNFVTNYNTSLSRKFAYRIGKILMRVFHHHLTGTSDSVLDTYGYDKWPYKQIRTSPNYCGIFYKNLQFNVDIRNDYRNKYGYSDDDLIVLFVGRISLNNYDSAPNQKNPEFAFKLAQHAMLLKSNVKFLFVGKVEEELFKRDDIKLLLDGGVVKFMGMDIDVHKYYSAADVLLFPSKWEGLGMVSVEAQAAGLPVICSDTIPKEADVVSALISRVSLDEDLSRWYGEIVNIVRNKNRACFNDALKDSGFNISVSVNKILDLV